MDRRLAAWMVCGLVVLVGSASAEETTPAAPASSAQKVERDQGERSHDPLPGDKTAVDDDLLEFLDILVEMTVLDSVETIETLQAAGEEDEP